jgi:hypothetical protein
MTYDGETISLWPSIGNWTLACRSHYVIERNQVIEARPWSDRQVAGERHRDHAAKARHYGVSAGPPTERELMTRHNRQCCASGLEPSVG